MVKNLIRLFFVNLVALWTADQLFIGLSINGGWSTLLLGTFVLEIVGIMIKPILNVLLLPINLLTLGAFRWVINALTLYLVTLVVPDIKVAAFLFPGLSSSWFAIPSFWLTTLLAYVVISLTISFIIAILSWLTD